MTQEEVSLCSFSFISIKVFTVKIFLVKLIFYIFLRYYFKFFNFILNEKRNELKNQPFGYFLNLEIGLFLLN